MNKFIKKLLREDLICYSTKLEEGINQLDLKLVKNIPVSDEQRKKLLNINWKDISVEDVGTEYLKIDLPYGNFSEGILLRLQETPNGLYQTHIDLAKSLQGLKLSPKIYKAVINYMGYIYSSKSRMMNPIVNKILQNLSNDSELDCYKNDSDDDICFTQNKNKDYLNAKKDLLIKFGYNPNI